MLPETKRPGEYLEQRMNSEFLDLAQRWLDELPGTARQTWLNTQALMSLPAQQPPWRGTGIHVHAGQSYSLFAAGRIQWAPRDPTLYAGPRFHFSAQDRARGVR